MEAMVASQFRRPLVRIVLSGSAKDMATSKIGRHDEVVCWIRMKDDGGVERLELRLDQNDGEGEKVGKYTFFKVENCKKVIFEKPKTEPE